MTFPSSTETNSREQCKAIILRSGKELEEVKPKEKNSTQSNDNEEHNTSIEQVPNYAKFIKDIVTKKRRFGDYETVLMTEECSAVLQRKLPQKLKDPGSFTIPCEIGNTHFGKVLCNLGASINLMPLSIFQNLGLGEVKSSTICLQLADRSLTYPRGIVEDVLVRVDKFILPADFVVLDMEEDKEIPIILGRPFLTTGGVVIDVQQGELTLHVNGEKVKFNIYRSLKHPSDTLT
ncbi:hypothetical protein K2173_001056 [Erythroxylum novogranatense]|uniref:Aspartic peptidase DDI1-type domain-containing protein n=1 Tax=Erythroxylum novogranatense TaxID=1862640 RepID=A0AAV8SJ17_9ROSI|nr:hypothetical protein K2173_001056 [Erythroxylum novogranatense]